MKIRRIFVFFCVVAGLSAWLVTPVNAACENLREGINDNRRGFEEMEGEKVALREKLHQAPDTGQRHEIKAHIEDIERTQMRLNEDLGTLEHELSKCEQPNENNSDGLHPGIVAAIIGAIGAVLAALIGLLRRT